MGRFIWIVGLAVVLAACWNNTPVPITPTVTTTIPSSGQCRIRGALSDPNCTPGATYPPVTQSTIGTTICVSGWTKTIRPPASYTDDLKVQQIAQYGYSDTSPADYEEDHLISLELGGQPTDPRNLWPQPRYGSPNATNKDKVENYLKAQVCNGKLSLADAQKGIATDWTQYLSAVAVSAQDISSEDPDDNGD